MNDDELPGMLAYARAISDPDRNDPGWPLPSFDARDWAESFCKQHPDLDRDEMTSWFACALMRGFDEREFRGRNNSNRTI